MKASKLALQIVDNRIVLRKLLTQALEADAEGEECKFAWCLAEIEKSAAKKTELARLAIQERPAHEEQRNKVRRVAKRKMHPFKKSGAATLKEVR